MEKHKLHSIIQDASAQIAPYFPLEHFVAVNPYQGYSESSFDDTVHRLARINGIQGCADLPYYLNKWEDGSLTASDIELALENRSYPFEINEFLRLSREATNKQHSTLPYPTLSDALSLQDGKRWSELIGHHLSQWAAHYFDTKQALWKNPLQTKSIFAAWKAEFANDYSLDLAGLKGFRKSLLSLPNRAIEALEQGITALQIETTHLPEYFSRLLHRHLGWASYIAYLDWQNHLEGKEETKLTEFLAILVSCETALSSQKLLKDWEIQRNRFYLRPKSRELELRLIWQEALEVSHRRQLSSKFNSRELNDNKVSSSTPSLQAAFCIDVRSEVMRRSLESVDFEIETIGYAGFFGMPIEYTALGHEKGQAQCPVLLNPVYQVDDGEKEATQKEADNRRIQLQLKKLKHQFKSAAIGCFGFVSPLGLTFLPKLISNSFGWSRPVPEPEKAGLSKQWNTTHHVPDIRKIPFDDRVKLARNTLAGLSLKEQFAPWILLVGHGGSSTNNPHATGLDCGACGGHTGEVNAQVCALILNDKQVRLSLEEEGIFIPEKSRFIAALHNTTTDEIRLLPDDTFNQETNPEWNTLNKKLQVASEKCRIERALRLNLEAGEDVHQAILKKSKLWSEVRPEWGLAGCSTFVIADRMQTKNIDLGGSSFLHSYNWKNDPGFAVLEQIMTAPMVVTSWINLQYYASTVDQKHHGAGNKTLHNVTSGIGVFEGHSGDLRIGLPFQSVHNGKTWEHTPIKLHVVIHAPIHAINRILEKHSFLKKLVDNQWIHILALGDDGRLNSKYEKDLKWKKMENHTQTQSLEPAYS